MTVQRWSGVSVLVAFNHDGFECNLNRILQWTLRTKGLLQCALSTTQSYSSCIQIHHSWKSPKQAHHTITVLSQYKLRQNFCRLLILVIRAIKSMQLSWGPTNLSPNTLWFIIERVIWMQKIFAQSYSYPLKMNFFSIYTLIF